MEVDEHTLDMMAYEPLANLGQRLGILMDDKPPLEVLRLRIKRAKWH